MLYHLGEEVNQCYITLYEVGRVIKMPFLRYII